MPSFYRMQLEDWLHQLAIGPGRLLDVGGSQKPVAPRLGRCEATEIATLDLPNPHESAPLPDIAIDISLTLPSRLTPYDHVFCLEVMEYVWNPVQAAENLFAFTKPGGRLYISFPFVYPMHNPIGCDFLRYTEEGARKILEHAGFEIESVRPRVARSPHALAAFYATDGMKHRRDDTVPHTGYLIIAKKP